MSVAIDLESEPGIAVATGFGSLTLDDIKDSAAALWRTTNGESTRILWDLREATVVLDGDAVRELAEFIKKLVEGPQVRSALVASGDLAYGLGRMYQSFRETPDSQTQVFRDRALALEWLNEP